MSQPFLGEIRAVSFPFAPKNWAFCNGALLSIAQNSALFSLLGTTYGGNGQTNFALPDLRGRIGLGSGQGPGLPPFDLGQVGGEESHTLLVSEMAQHNHGMVCTAGAATSTSPTNNYAVPVNGKLSMYANSQNATANPAMVSNSGNGQAHENRQPFVVVNYVICTSGIFPSRN